MSFAGGNHFKHDLLRKYVYTFGSLFSDMTVERHDANGNRLQTIPVPISYAPKEKLLVRVDNDPNLDNPHAVQLPRMGFEITSMSYDSQRKLNTTNKRAEVEVTDGQNVKYQYQSVPYDISFSLYVMVKNAYDGVQVVEQILPFFTPDWTSSVNIIPDMNITIDVPLIFQSMVTEDNYEGDYDTRRSLIYTFDFLMKAQLYGPVKNSRVINKVTTDTFAVTGGVDSNVANTDIGTTATSSRLTTEPGLTVDGLPTANSANSVGVSTIKSTDPFGFVQNFNFLDNGTIEP